MLHLILGHSGSGKTQHIRSLLCERTKDGAHGMILLVPEQFSFESERAMLELLGPRDAGRVEILSFSRLVDAVFRVYGGVSGTRIDDGGRMLLMSLALEEAQDHLELYARHKESPALAAKLLDLVAECHQCAVTPADLHRAADKLPDSVLRRKTRELSLILDTYGTLVSRSFLDDQDDLTRLNDTLLDHPFFQGRIVAIDAFKSFTVQEQRILFHILSQAQEVYLTLCTDSLADKQGGMGSALQSGRMSPSPPPSYWKRHTGFIPKHSRLWSGAYFGRRQKLFPIKQRISCSARRRTGPPNAILWRARQNGCCARKASAAGIWQSSPAMRMVTGRK
jgi:ATP-dependent helicase/nuclease subunit B